MISFRNLIILWLLTITSNKADEVTFVAPKFVAAKRTYDAYVRTSDLDHPVNLAMIFREQRITETLYSDDKNYVPVTFDQGGRAFAAETSFELKVLMKRDQKCHDKVFNISRVVKKSFIFVQLDKPIYKPGDAIKFRIVSLNNTLQPFKPDNVNVTLFDPKGAFTQDRSNLTDVNSLGLFNETFYLPDNAEEGKWSLFIKIGKVNTTKTIKVQKYTLPFYEFKMHTKPKVGLDERNFLVDVEAVYSFGGFIAGHVSINISSIAGSISRNANIDNLKSFNISLINDLSLTLLPNGRMLVLNVTGTFEDHLGLSKPIKTNTIEVYPSRKCDIEIINLQNYTEGIPYEFDVIVSDFDGNVIINSTTPVNAKFENGNVGCKHQNIEDGFIVNAVSSLKIDNPKVCEGENVLKVSYANQLCEKSYDVLSDDESLKGLLLRYVPPQPKLNTLLNITVYSQVKIKEIFWIAINRLGMVHSGKKECSNCKKLEFKVNVTKEMLPKSTFYVFASPKISNIETFVHNKIEVLFDQLSENYVDLKIPTNPLKPADKFNMEIKSMMNSEVSLLAIDKSLQALATGNDLEMTDFIKIYGNYDSDVHILSYDFSSPRGCTAEDEKLLELIKTNKTDTQSSKISVTYDAITDDKDEASRSVNQKEGKTFFIRSNFPESWLYETHNMDNATKTLELTLPDTITSWIFTAFSLNEKGFALATPRHLVVKQDFFVKMNLPYLGRVGEILAVDAIVFNFLDTDTSVEVAFSIVGKGDIVEKNADCSGENLRKNSYTKTVNAKHGQGTKVTFNFLPKETGTIKITLLATSSHQNERDALKRSINVVNYGIKEFKRAKYVSNFAENQKFYASTNFGSCTSISAGVAGDIVSNAFKYQEEFIHSMGCGEQTLSNFNTNLQIYLYLYETNSLTSEAAKQGKDELMLDYTRVKGFITQEGAQLWLGYNDYYPCLTAYMASILGYAMQENVISPNETLIMSSLNYLMEKSKDFDNRYCKEPMQYDNVDLSDPDSPSDTSELKLKNSLIVYIQSFILIGFLTNQDFISDYKSRYGEYVANKIQELEELSVDAYASTLLVYVKALEGSPKNIKSANEVLKQLKEINSHQNGDKLFYFYDKKEENSLNYQMSSYVSLTYMALAKRDASLIAEVEPIINWLAGIADFGEPWTESIATEALTKAAKIIAKIPADYTLKLIASDNEVTLNVSNTNWRDYQYVEVSTTSNDIKLNASGRGYLSVDVVCEQYNQNAKNSDFLILNVDSSGFNDESDLIGSLNICVKCGKGGCIDMIILEVDLQSGFVYDANINDHLSNSYVKKVEIYKGSTVFTVYMQDFESNFDSERCGEFKIHRKSMGTNLKDGYVRAYLYNHYDNYTSTPFNVMKKFCILDLPSNELA